MPRKKPFSGKAKKQQLKAKKANRRNRRSTNRSQPASTATSPRSDGSEGDGFQEVEAPLAVDRGRRGKKGKSPIYSLFPKDSKEEVQARRKDAQKPLERKGKRYRDWGLPNCEVPLPVRPRWDGSMDSKDFQKAEESAFEGYVRDLVGEYGRRLNKFELNVEVWRQLWRLTDMSDVLAICCDMRCPPFHLPRGLLAYAEHHEKRVVLVLTKPDLVPDTDVVEKFISDRYPNVPFVTVCNKPAGKGKKREKPVGIDNMLQKFRTMAPGYQEADPSEPVSELTTDLAEASLAEEKETAGAEAELEGEAEPLAKNESSAEPPKNESRFTVGFIGQPNCGKSSIINAVIGEIKVGVSATPGKTKHLQTLLVGSDLRIVDCPGLIFPAVDIPFALQVLLGVYPVAQTQEPYSVVQFLAERFDLVEMFRLIPFGEKPSWKDPDYDWSAYEVCESYALRRRYNTKQGNPDCYRGANEILRMVVNGKIAFHAEFD